MGEQYIISIDQSTQSTKAMVFDEYGMLVARDAIAHQQIIDHRGYIEHDGIEIRDNVFAVIKSVITKSGIDRSRIMGIAVANQRESVIVWDRLTGEPIYNSIVWQCNRAAHICDRLSESAEYVRTTTGLQLSPFFSGPKIAWILENVPLARKKAEAGQLCCGTMDSWVIYNLTNKISHKTDFSNASRMMLMNLTTNDWDHEICSLLDIPMSMLPEICDTDALFGLTDIGGFLEKLVPIRCSIGDSHACLYGQGCYEKGMCITGYGTGSCVIMNLGEQPLLSTQGVLTSIAWKVSDGIRYMFDGVINYSGAVVTWIYKELGLAASPEETAILAEQANVEDQTYLVPAFSGIGAPHWSNKSNAVFYGMSRMTGKSELVKAALESIAYQVADVVFAMASDMKEVIPFMRASGGPAKNNYLMQFQSDVLNFPIQVPDNEEMTCYGAALIAGHALGIYDKQLQDTTVTYREFNPQMSEEKREQRIAGWNRAVKCALE